MCGFTEAYAKCRTEQDFKMLYLKNNANQKYHSFCIETEETVKGFPDVISINKFDLTCTMYEFKFTKTGRIKFQPTQPAFYKAHPELLIRVIAYNLKTKMLHDFGALEVFNPMSNYFMNELAEVSLCQAERRKQKEHLL